MKKITIITTLLLVNLFSFSQVQIVFEDFESNIQPLNWSMIDANTDLMPDGVQAWTFGSNDLSGNVVQDFTTNAAIFDDDAAGDTGQNNNVWLLVDPFNHIGNGGGTASADGYDVSAFDQVTLTYDYALEVLSPGSETLSVGVYDKTNSVWLILKTYDTTTNPTQDSIDITAALNANPQLDPTDFIFGFNYNDINGGFAWSAGIDNVSLVGTIIQPINDIFFTHTTTVDNIGSIRTIIDHPALNNNPDATILFTHTFNNEFNIYHDKVMGVFYNFNLQKWIIYNEDQSDMPVNLDFLIYVAGQDANAFTYTATQENIDFDPEPSLTVINHPDLIGGQNLNLFMSHFLSDSFIFNNFNYGFVYSLGGSKWFLATEFDGTTDPVVLDSKYKILIEPTPNDAISYFHLTTASNISANQTLLDHPLLNNNPNAEFIINHTISSNGVIYGNLKQNIGRWYNGERWVVYLEDFLVDMPENQGFNILIKNDNAVSVNDNEFANFNVYPNPVEDTLTIDVSEEITQVKIVNLLGQEIIKTKSLSDNSIDVSNLETGIYFVKITVNNTEYSKKVIKK